MTKKILILITCLLCLSLFCFIGCNSNSKQDDKPQTPTTYQIRFEDESGNLVKLVDFTMKDRVIEEPAVPEKVGYTGVWGNYVLKAENFTVKPVYNAITYYITFEDGNGGLVKKIGFTLDDNTVDEPTVPEKAGYTGAWENYVLKAESFTVKPVYNAITYYITFEDENGGLIEKIGFTLDDNTVDEPTVPEKAGYTGVWENYVLRAESFTVKPVYDEIWYSVTFMADGQQVGQVQHYSTNTKTIIPPAVPVKQWYEGEWEEYELDGGNKVVNAIYTEVQYSVTFTADGQQVGQIQYYSVSNKSIQNPAIPNKEGYEGKWEEYELNGGNKVVNAVYTEIWYSVTFMADGKQVGQVQHYSVNHKDIKAPAVPYKEDFEGKWEEYSLTIGDIVVNAIYTKELWTKFY